MMYFEQQQSFLGQVEWGSGSDFRKRSVTDIRTEALKTLGGH
jgi:hypothetical protein